MSRVGNDGGATPEGAATRATDLMREALGLLNIANAGVAAGHLRTAIEVAGRIPPTTPGNNPTEGKGAGAIAADPSLIRAMGGALAMFTAILARNKIVSFGEAADLLGVYAVTTAETSDEEGLILGCWASMLRDLAQT